jgi:hypothetical protein
MNTDIQPASINLPSVTTPPAPEATPPAASREPQQAGYPMPKLTGPLAQSGRVGILGLGEAYDKTVANNQRFQADVLALLRNNSIPFSDAQAGYIVSGLLFLSRFDAGQLQGDERHQVQQVINYAQARLDDFLSASKANALSGGQVPPAPVLANVRNEALAVVNKYLSRGIVEPNVKPAPYIPKGTTTI